MLDITMCAVTPELVEGGARVSPNTSTGSV